MPRGHGAGDPVRLRDFQTDLVEGAFAPGIRTALVSIPRANGKTALTAMPHLGSCRSIGRMSSEPRTVSRPARFAA